MSTILVLAGCSMLYLYRLWWLGRLAVMVLDLRLHGCKLHSRLPHLVLGWVAVFGGQTTSVFHQAAQTNSASYPQWDRK